MVVTMPVKFDTRAVKVGNSIRITIPKEIASHLHIESGDRLHVWVDDSCMLVAKCKEERGVEEDERRERERRKALTRREGPPPSIPSRERSYT
jgi:AbrB family looped-hinge helix DNA binding protein